MQTIWRYVRLTLQELRHKFSGGKTNKTNFRRSRCIEKTKILVKLHLNDIKSTVSEAFSYKFFPARKNLKKLF